jgi:predicted PurR-regulated permease PerM
MWLAVAITLIAVLALILGLAAALALSVAQLATILSTYQDSFNRLVDDLRSELASLGVGRDQIRAALDQISFSSIASLPGGVLAGLAGIFSNLLFLLFVVVFLAFITNYIPHVGFIIGVVPPALLVLLDGGPQLMIIAIVAYSVINFGGPVPPEEADTDETPESEPDASTNHTAAG